MGILRDIGAPGLIIIVLGALLIFGPKRLPELGESIGKMLSEFKKAVKGAGDQDQEKYFILSSCIKTRKLGTVAVQTNLNSVLAFYCILKSDFKFSLRFVLYSKKLYINRMLSKKYRGKSNFISQIDSFLSFLHDKGRL